MLALKTQWKVELGEKYFQVGAEGWNFDVD